MNNFLKGNTDSLSKKASSLRMRSQELADCLKSGSFRSHYRGQGMEFLGVREYLAGDDVRTLDWNVTAKMGKPYVKMFEEDHQLEVFLIVDRSFSMFSGSKGKVKYEKAAETAALLTMACEMNSSPVGAVFFDGKIHFAVKSKSGRFQSMLLLSQLDEASPVNNGSALNSAMNGAVKMLKNHSMIFVISDFRVSGWEETFKKLSWAHDVTLIKITDPSELELPEIGTVPFTDSETGKRLVLPTSKPALKSMWRDEYRKRNDALKKLASKSNAGFITISTEEDASSILSRYFQVRRAF